MKELGAVSFAHFRETVLVLEEESHKRVTRALARHPEKESRERSVQLHSSLVLFCLSVY